MTIPYDVVSTEYSMLGRFRIHLDTVKKDGVSYPYSYIEQKGSVGILGFAEDDIILIKQYRHSLGRYEYEIPGGGIEAGESSAVVAEREMLEETGYKVERLEYLGSYYPSPGSSNEKCYLFLAYCIKESEPKKEPLELIDVELTPVLKFENMISDGSFKHSMGLVAWLKYKMRQEK